MGSVDNIFKSNHGITYGCPTGYAVSQKLMSITNISVKKTCHKHPGNIFPVYKRLGHICHGHIQPCHKCLGNKKSLSTCQEHWKVTDMLFANVQVTHPGHTHPGNKCPGEKFPGNKRPVCKTACW